MLAIAQRSMDKKIIINSYSFFDEFELPHQPECLLTLSRRAGKLPKSSAHSRENPSQRTGYLSYGRNRATEFIRNHTSLVRARFCPPALNKLLTFPRVRDYSFAVTAKSVIGFDSLCWSGEEPQASSRAAFLLPMFARSLWVDWAGSRKARRCSTGLSTRSVLPTLLTEGRQFIKRTGANIMSSKSKVASTRRKSKSVSPIATPANVSHIDPKRREAYALRDWADEFTDFLEPLEGNDVALVHETIRLILKKPERKKPEKSEVIKFSARRKQPAMEEV